MHNDFSKLVANYPPAEAGKYQVLGWMTPGKYASLLRSIQAQGQVQVPIVKDSEGNILDGHHRQLAHQQLKIKEPLKVQTLGAMSEVEKRHYALSVNLVRRQVSRKQRREIIAAELRRTPDLSNSALAHVCGTTKKTVLSVREELIAKGEIRRFDRLRRKNGGTYPVPQIITSDTQSANRAQKALERLGKDAPRKPMSVQNAEWNVRKKNRTERALAPAPRCLPDEIDIRHSDFRHLDLAKNSVDLVLTDPPYAQDALPLWTDMAKIAPRILKPGGLLIAYSGVAHLPEVYRLLSDHLNYVWTISISLGTGRTFIRRTRGRSGWRPALVYCNGEYDPKRGFVDTCFGAKQEKDLHDWQQPLSESRRLIETFSEPGNLILDPFGGSFTTAVAAHELGRRFIGCDVEEQNVLLGKHRLAEAVANPLVDEPVYPDGEPVDVPSF